MRFLKNKQYIASYILTSLIAIVFFVSSVTASENTYPTKGWQTSTPEEQGMRSQWLVEMMEHVKKNNFGIDSILIVRNGYVVLDAYFYPFSKGKKHIIHSCTKSVMSALIGIAIDKGYINSVNQPIIDFFPDNEIENLDDLKESITLKDLLMMASGLGCRDSYLYGWKGLLEMRASQDWAQYVLDLPMSEIPGKKFEYCNGVSFLLSVIIQNTTGMRTLDFANKHLFGPLDRNFRIPRVLLQNYIIFSAETNKSLPPNDSEQARLDAQVKRVAKEIAFTWTSETEGVAREGVFRRSATPAFKFEYPLGSRKATLEYPGQVMVMRTPGDVEFSASIIDIPEGMKLENFGPKFFAVELENVGSDIKIISNREITLKCGTKAYRTEIKWLGNNSLPITTYLVSAYKSSKIVLI